MLQLVAYVGFIVAVGYLSTAPSYRYLDPDVALLRLSFSHAGERKEACRRYTPEEIAEMAPNMRRALDCARERVPVVIQLELDGKPLYGAVLPPSGLAADGNSTAYERFALDPGTHRLVARLRDSRRSEGFDYERVFELTVSRGDNVVLDFRPATDGFRLL